MSLLLHRLRKTPVSQGRGTLLTFPHGSEFKIDKVRIPAASSTCRSLGRRSVIFEKSAV